MKVTVFAKKMKTKDEGREFYRYFGTLVKKDGTEVKTAIKFRQECGAPQGKNCPVNIEVAKDDCNFKYGERVDEETGIIYNDNVLWIKEWRQGEEYRDTSMDEFE